MTYILNSLYPHLFHQQLHHKGYPSYRRARLAHRFRLLQPLSKNLKLFKVRVKDSDQWSYTIVELWGSSGHRCHTESHGVVWIIAVGLQICVRDSFNHHGEGIFADVNTSRIVLGSLIFLVFVAGSIKILYNRRKYVLSA